MRIILPVVIVAAVGIGLYVGVFHVSSDNTPEQSNVTVTVDKQKLGEAKDKAKDQLKELGQEVKEKAGAIARKPTTVGG